MRSMQACVCHVAAAALVAFATAAPAWTPSTALFFESFNGVAESGLASFVKSSLAQYADQPVALHRALAAQNDSDLSLTLLQAAKRYAVTAPFAAPITVQDEPLVIQYDVALTEGLTCGGAYIKLLQATDNFQASETSPDSPYVIMFGPDRCGATDKVHFIIRWKNPVTGEVQEKHMEGTPTARSDKLPHTYTLVIRPDDSFLIKIDGEVEKEGFFATSFKPAIVPPAEIDDPTDLKPADWVDEEEMPDATAVKPADWDESAPAMIEDAAAVKPAGWLDDEPDMIADPSVQKPDDWDEEEDGEFEAPTIANPRCEAAPGCGEWKRPMIKNPAYKGKWVRPMIKNPAYKGEWKARQIANPAFFADDNLHRLGGAAIRGVAVEVWTMNGGMQFDNFLVTRSEAEATAAYQQLTKPKADALEAEYAAKERTERRAARVAAAEQGGVMEKVRYVVGEATDMALEQPAAAAATAVVLLLSLLGSCAYCCCGRDNSDSAAHAHTEATAEATEAEAEADTVEATAAAPSASEATPAATTASQADAPVDADATATEPAKSPAKAVRRRHAA